MLKSVEFRDGSSCYTLTNNGRLFCQVVLNGESQEGEIQDLHGALKILYRELDR